MKRRLIYILLFIILGLLIYYLVQLGIDKYYIIKRNIEEKKLIEWKKKVKERKFKEDSLSCICSEIEAREEIKRGNITAYYNYQYSYFEQIMKKEYGIYSSFSVPIPIRSCGIRIMDSVIFKKYGKDIFEKTEKKSDSIYKIRNDFYIDLDGYYTQADKYAKYKCGGIDYVYNYIEGHLKKEKLIPLNQDTCFSKELLVDIDISKNGKLVNIHIIKKLNPKIDNRVIELLKNLACDWEPAIDESIKVNFRKRLYFLFENINNKCSYAEHNLQ